jgi:hypothetical protein
VPETAALATALAALTARFAEARSRERKLAADLSHRLRTPLTALALDAGGIGDGPAAERVKQTISSLESDVDALIRAAPSTEGPARCDVAEVVRRRMGFWSALAQHSGRSCTVTAEPPAVIALAEDDLAAVVDALLGNVFRYTADGTAFAVTVVRHAGWVSLVVDDAGLGVADPAAALSRGVSMGGGTGLGLAISRDAVEATGGTIHVERAPPGSSAADQTWSAVTMSAPTPIGVASNRSARWAAIARNASWVAGRTRSMSICAPVARCGSNGTSITARQRASKWRRTRSVSMCLLARSHVSTITASATRSAGPRTRSQSSVLFSLLAPSAVGEPTITRLCASASVPPTAACTSPLPESVITTL